MKIADLFVLFSAKGVDSVVEATKRVQEGMQKANDVIKSIGSVVQATFGAASATILGFATAGVAASATGQVLGFEMERLSRTIAGLFAPEIRKLIDLIRGVTDWINSLSNSQKKMIAFFTLAAAGITAFLLLLPVLTAGIQSLVTQIVELTVAIVTAESSTGIGALLPLIGFAIEAVTGAVLGLSAATAGFLVFTEEGNNLLKELADAIMPLVTEAWELLADVFQIVAEVAKAVLIPVLKIIVAVLKEMMHFLRMTIEGFRELFGIPKRIETSKQEDRGALAPRVGGFEGVQDTWRRIAEASRLGGGGGKSTGEQQLDAQLLGNGLLTRIKEILQGRPNLTTK
jgi:hypothetical protein